MTRKSVSLSLVALGTTLVVLWSARTHQAVLAAEHRGIDAVFEDARSTITEGQKTFRFDTFGDEAFWGDTLRLHEAVEGAKLGGSGPGLTPAMALALGLKVDVQALPASLLAQIRAGKVDLNSPATTLALLKLNAVVGLTGKFNQSGTLRSIGIQCALCHSSVDNSFAPGIGRRLDAWANRDLNVGAIVALAPNLQPVADVLGADVGTVLTVLKAWGPGRFDAELFLDGKGFQPASNPVHSAATLIPPAFGLAGVNLHTWTGWGSVTHWNAFVANLEMHGKGRFFDTRLDNQAQFPVAARNHFFDLPHISPDDDLITKKLPALHFYQLAIHAPKPEAGKDFDPAAARRGDELFSGRAQCNNCHVEPIWTEPGWNLHAGTEICIDSFQADRAPDHRYRTAPLGGLFIHQKGGFYHDGRFATLGDVVNHYNGCFGLGLNQQEKSDLIQYLLSL